VEKEVMAESQTDPEKHITLDTDWQTALAMMALFVICAFMGIGTTLMTLHGTLKIPSNSWLTLSLLVFAVYCGVVCRERPFRVAIIVFAVGPFSRIVLWMAHASSETLLINEVFVRWIHTGAYLAGCVYVVYWLRRKITYV
jgi:hypothetical protein